MEMLKDTKVLIAAGLILIGLYLAFANTGTYFDMRDEIDSAVATTTGLVGARGAKAILGPQLEIAEGKANRTLMAAVAGYIFIAGGGILGFIALRRKSE